MKHLSKNIKGFTIIEIMIVIVIIAILSGIIMVNTSGYNKKSKIAATQAQENQIAEALILYQYQYGCLPNPNACSGSPLVCSCLPSGSSYGLLPDKQKEYKNPLGIPLANAQSESSTSDDGGSGSSTSDGGSGSSSSSPASGDSNIIQTLIDNKFLGKGSFASNDAWGKPYKFAFNKTATNGNKCNFIYSAGPNGTYSFTGYGANCASFFSSGSDDIWLQIQ